MYEYPPLPDYLLDPPIWWDDEYDKGRQVNLEDDEGWDEDDEGESDGIDDDYEGGDDD